VLQVRRETVGSERVHLDEYGVLGRQVTDGASDDCSGSLAPVAGNAVLEHEPETVRPRPPGLGYEVRPVAGDVENAP
jgi:hypothetical protein